MTTISSHLLLLAVTILVVGVLTVSAENEIFESRGIKSVNGGKQLLIALHDSWLNLLLTFISSLCKQTKGHSLWVVDMEGRSLIYQIWTQKHQLDEWFQEMTDFSLDHVMGNDLCQFKELMRIIINL